MIRQNTDDYQGRKINPIDTLMADFEEKNSSPNNELIKSSNDDYKQDYEVDQTSNGVNYEEDSKSVNLTPKLPQYGPALLMPSKANSKGKPEWQIIDNSNINTKLRKGLEAGLKRKKRYTRCRKSEAAKASHKGCK